MKIVAIIPARGELIQSGIEYIGNLFLQFYIAYIIVMAILGLQEEMGYSMQPILKIERLI